MRDFLKILSIAFVCFSLAACAAKGSLKTPSEIKAEQVKKDKEANKKSRSK